MANHKGSEGVVKVGANTVAEVRSWTVSEEAETIEDTAMGDAARTYQVGLKTWSGSCDVFWDETDTNGQVALAAGSSVTSFTQKALQVATPTTRGPLLSRATKSLQNSTAWLRLQLASLELARYRPQLSNDQPYP